MWLSDCGVIDSEVVLSLMSIGVSVGLLFVFLYILMGLFVV